jgi:UDP-N-acetylglucosamine 2-epimerase (non-hydrolysing)
LKIAIVLGTRPEAIKLAPVARRFLELPHEFETRVIVTAQHRGLLDQTLQAFAITPDYDLDVMRPGQTLAESTSRIVAALDPVLAKETPDLVMVQGDTTTTFCGALGAFYRGVPVAHVEAGLRSGDFRQPFPEEMSRVLSAQLATLHFAPTDAAAENLLREGVASDRVLVTGNTGIDALLETRDALASGSLWAPGTRRTRAHRARWGQEADPGHGAPAGKFWRRVRRYLRGAAPIGGA